jgi:hypothetical protein
MRFVSITLDLQRVAAGATLMSDRYVRTVERDHRDSYA